MRAITYARVATAGQGQDESLLGMQERACRDHARSHGWVVVESVHDVASGLSLDRPGMDRLRRLLHDGEAEIVMAYDADRLTRDPMRLAELIDEVEGMGARLDLVTQPSNDPDFGRLLLAARAPIAGTDGQMSKQRPGGES